MFKNVNPGTDAWIGTGIGKSGVNLNLVVTKKYARAEIYINRGDREENKKIFDKFLSQKEMIEKNFGSKLTWERMDENVTSRIKYQLDGVNVFDEADWDAMNAFLANAAINMHAVFKNVMGTLNL